MASLNIRKTQAGNDDGLIGPSEFVFSIEIECMFQVCGYNSKGFHGLNPKSPAILLDQEAREQIADFLRSRNIWANPIKPDDLIGSIHPDLQDNLQRLRQTYPDPTKLSYYSNGIWSIRTAENLEVTKDMICSSDVWSAVSIKSPLISTDDDCADMISYVLDVLTQNFCIGFPTDARLKVELRHHSKAFTTQHVKNLAKIIWYASPLIDNIHPAHCQAGSPRAPGLAFSRAFNPFTRPFLDELDVTKNQVPKRFSGGLSFRRGHSSMFDLPPIETRSASAIVNLRRLNRISDMKELVHELGVTYAQGGKVFPFPNAAYNFRSLSLDDPVMGFGQHAATFSFDATRHWLRLCLAIAEIATGPQIYVDQLLVELGSSQTAPPSLNTISDLVQRLGCQQSTAEHFAKCPEAGFPELSKVLYARSALDFEASEDLYTFGVEIETLVPFGLSAEDDPKPEDPRWHPVNVATPPMVNRVRVLQEHLEKLLLDNGYLAFPSPLDAKSRSRQLINLHRSANQLGLALRNDVNLEYQCFYLQEDCSLSYLKEELVHGHTDGCHGIELSSPITPFNERGLRRLTGAISLLRRNVRFVLDGSCSLHVHVGNTRNWTILNIKKILTLFWLCEPMILPYIHPLRLRSDYCVPLTADLREIISKDPVHNQAFKAHVPYARLPIRQQRALATLWSLFRLSPIEYLLEDDEISCAGAIRLSLRSLHPYVGADEDEYKGTVEFRYLQGCMDNELMVEWVRICVALVRFAHRSEAAGFREMLELLIRGKAEITDPSSSIVTEVFEAIGIPDAQEFWVRQVAKNEAQARQLATLPKDFTPWLSRTSLPVEERIRPNYEVFGEFVKAETPEEEQALQALLGRMFPSST